MRQTTLFVGVLAVSLLGHGQRSGLEAAPARVLYLTQSAAFPHPVLPHSEAVLTRLAAESDQFDQQPTVDFRIGRREKLTLATDT